MMPKAKEAARKALTLDDNLGEAHTALGQILASNDYDFAGAEREYKRAIELNPNYATAHQYYGELLTNVGKHEESLAELRRALEIEPALAHYQPDVWRCSVFCLKIRRSHQTAEKDA